MIRIPSHGIYFRRYSTGSVVQSNDFLSGLLSVWSMENVDAADQTDEYNGLNLINHGGGTTRSTTKKQGSYSVDCGGGTYMDNTSSLLKTTGSFSVAMWFNTQTQDTQNMALVARWGADTSWIAFCANDVVRFTIRYGDNSDNHASISSTAINNNNWHLLVFTYNAATLTGYISVDNETFENTGLTEGIRVTTDPFTISNYSGGGTAYGGLIDQTAFWYNRVLTQADVAKLWNSGNGLFYNDWTV